MRKKMRFKDFLDRFEGISPSTLTSSLKKLENEGLLDRKFFNEIPPKVEYSITKKGKELLNSIKPLLEWSEINQKESICTCNEKISKITEFRNRSLNKMIEASLCACTCLPLMTGFLIFGNPIF